MIFVLQAKIKAMDYITGYSVHQGHSARLKTWSCNLIFSVHFKAFKMLELFVFSGGTIIDINGTNFDSIANPRLNVQMDATSAFVGQDVTKITTVYSSVS
jgi:hypothetical protein